MTREQYDKYAMAKALAHYGAIASLVTRPLTPEQHAAELKNVCATRHLYPHPKDPELMVERKVSPRQANRLEDWYRNGRHYNGVFIPPGFNALLPLPRKDQGLPRVLSEEDIQEAIRLRNEAPTRNTAALLELLASAAEAKGVEPPRIKEATLAYHLRSRHATRRELKKQGRVYPRYEHKRRNAVWQGDWSQGIPLPNPLDPKKIRYCHLHAFIDDHSRYVPHGEFYFRQNLPCLQDAYRKAVLKGGLAEVNYFDNGGSYQHKQMKLMAARLGVQIVFATPYAPEGKGKIERFFKTVKDSLYPEALRANIQTLDELNSFFWAWLEKYHDRVHSETEQTPRERWEAGASEVRWADPAQLSDIFLWEEQRTVDKSGCVDLGGNKYAVSEYLVKQKVVVRFDPFDMSQIRIVHRGQFVQVASPQELVSHTFRKALPRRIEHPAPLESSTGYRKQLSEGYRRQADATLQRLQPGNEPYLTRSEFAALLVSTLGRSLGLGDSAASADFFARYAPLNRLLVEAALRRAVEDKGTQRHLRFYLDAVKTARVGKEGV
ncbi:MAG: transposase [Acidobacteriaceae bacterium]